MSKNKTDFIQIRISKDEKKRFAKLAKLQGQSLSEWIISKLSSDSSSIEIKKIYAKLRKAEDSSYILALLNDYLMNMPELLWNDALKDSPENIDIENLCYIASMIERATEIRGLELPQWVKDIGPLSKPYFGSKLKNLRMYLLINSPIAFRKRNIFIDASVGDRK